MANKSGEFPARVADSNHTEAVLADTTRPLESWEEAAAIKEEPLECDSLTTTESLNPQVKSEFESLDVEKMGFEVVVCSSEVKETSDDGESKDPLAFVHTEDGQAPLRHSNHPIRQVKKEMAGKPKIPNGVSDRTKKMMAVAQCVLEESDEEVDSEDSYISDGEDLIVPSEEYDTDDSDNEGSPADGVKANPANHHDDQAIIDVDSETRSQSYTSQRVDCHDEAVQRLPRGSERRASTSKAQHSASTSKAQQSASFYGKKKCFTWSESPVRSGLGRESNRNTIRIRYNALEGPARKLGTAPTPKQVWDVLFTSNMKTEIITWTNAKLEKMRSRITNTDSLMYKDMDEHELDALFAIILFCSIFKSSRERLASLFSTSAIGRPLFRGIMTEKRCCILLRALRFDDSITRAARLVDDKAACISNIFSLFIENCQKNYSLGSRCTIDETLVAFRGRVNFKMFVPNKPAKYGIRLMCLTDADNAYLYDTYIYTGKGSDGATLSPEHKKLSIPSQSVIRLTNSIKWTNRNITCGNWFTSVELANELWKTNLTLVGTLKQNEPQIPPEFQPSPRRVIGSSIYGFTEDMTLVSHVTKKNKALVLLSTMHYTSCTDPHNGRPEIISFYNSTKSGVDTLDQKFSVYSSNRRTRRWPLAIFYHLMAACSSNAFTLYEMFPDAETKTRFEFVNDVALNLANNYIQRRLQIPSLPAKLKQTMQGIVGVQEEPVAVGIVKSDVLEKRKACRYCPYQLKRNTKFKCIKCETPTCGEHSKHLCCTCVGKV